MSQHSSSVILGTRGPLLLLRYGATLLAFAGLVGLVDASHAQSWAESGDAGNFPLGPAQVTRGNRALTTITGATVGVDRRDAYCIKIADPPNFSASTDTGATNFDTRLYLFSADGRALLANDDIDGSSVASRLTSVASDGSGVTITQPGEYVLVVAGNGDDPLDPTPAPLFEAGGDPTWVQAPDSSSGRFNSWLGGTVATGSYTVALAGTEPCRNQVDAVFGDGAFSAAVNRLCSNFDGSNFQPCGTVDPASIALTLKAATGFLDGDSHLDVVFLDLPTIPRACFGDGRGGFSHCTALSGHPILAGGVQIALMNDDAFPDLVYAVLASNINVCLGDGLGGFSVCSFIFDATSNGDFALGFVNADPYLDIVTDKAKVCLGNGALGFTCSSSIANLPGTPQDGVALADFDHDGDLDAFFVASSPSVPNAVCLSDGSGGISSLSCTAFGSTTDVTRAVQLADFNGDGHVDVVLAKEGAENSVCLGTGVGTFVFCSAVSPVQRATYDVAVEDLNSDSKLDLVFANLGAPNEVCLGNGAGTFSCSDIDASSDESRAVAIGEFASTNVLFEDGFETGDVTRWSAAVP